LRPYLRFLWAAWMACVCEVFGVLGQPDVCWLG
jgi:hypothetical protein